MLQLLGIIVALLLIRAVVALRALLAIPFAQVQARWVPAAPPSGVAHLYAEAEPALRAIGFGPARWLLTSRVDGQPHPQPLRAIYTHPDGGICVVGPPTDARRPHQLYLVYGHRLADGRMLSSQMHEAYSLLTDTAEHIGRVGDEADIASQWQAHRQWVSEHGNPVVLDDAALLDLFVGDNERHRLALIASGKLRALNASLAVPRWRFALRLLQAAFARPKAPTDTRPVKPAHLALLLRTQELAARNAPPRDVQWTLFGMSVLLFMAAGAWVWDTQTAAMIFVVVMLHELGHFLAMRAFGYRNVHLLALPLVGGVAIAHDAHPSALRRAWMSLLGPLPGVLIGWALLAWMLLGPAPDWTQPWLYALTLTFLFINYLNVLPIPPLDGAHVVEALLPPRWARMQTVVLGLTAAGGAWLAWDYGWYLLTGLALLQLVALPYRWRLNAVEQIVAQQPGFASRPPAEQTLLTLRVLEQQLGATAQAPSRIQEATQVLQRQRVAPMRALAATLTGLVYLALLAVPVMVLFYLSAFAPEPQIDAQIERLQQQQADLKRQVSTLDLRRLLESHGTLQAPASASALAAAEARLGRPLPSELRQLYRISDGLPELMWNPLAELAPAASAIDTDFAPYTDKLYLDTPDGEAVEIPLADTRQWWQIGGDDESLLLYLPEPHARLPHVRLVSLWLESPGAFRSVRDWLESEWMSEEMARMQANELAARTEAARMRLHGARVDELLQALEPADAGLSEWLSNQQQPSPPASEAAIVAAETRLRLQFADDHRALYRYADGVPTQQLLPLADLLRYADLVAPMEPERRRALLSFGIGGPPALLATSLPELHEEQLAGCLVVAAAGRTPQTRLPRLLWCDGQQAYPGWIEPARHLRWPGFRDWLLDSAAAYQGQNLESSGERP